MVPSRDQNEAVESFGLLVISLILSPFVLVVIPEQGELISGLYFEPVPIR